MRCNGFGQLPLKPAPVNTHLSVLKIPGYSCDLNVALRPPFTLADEQRVGDVVSFLNKDGPVVCSVGDIELIRYLFDQPKVIHGIRIPSRRPALGLARCGQKRRACASV